MHRGNDGDGQSSISGCNINDVTDELSSVSNGLHNKMLPTHTPIRASMMKTPVKASPSPYQDEDNEDDDFFDALDQFQALTYEKSSAKPQLSVGQEGEQEVEESKGGGM